ncbi:hypothetical protein FJZ53_04115 [Candidatus Woesearchaeota archaeon]|nr:hypothetical protein [Candidatus Woesearchaeota archaeon]
MSNTQIVYPKRSTAYKFWIKDLLNAIPISQEGIHLFEVRGKEVSRVNVIAAVVDQQKNLDSTFSSITLDDGTETIRAKAWKDDVKKLEEVRVGDPVMVIGKLRFYANEIFITPEIVKLQEPEWLLVRKKELERLYGKPQESERPKLSTGTAPPQEVVEEIVVEPTSTARQKILALVEKEPAKEGIQITKLIQASGLKEAEAEKAIDELLREGELFQPRTGYLKVI